MTGNSRSSQAKRAGSQVHRQRVGAIMGPTIVRRRFLVDAGGGAPVKHMQKLMSDLEPLEKKIHHSSWTPKLRRCTWIDTKSGCLHS